MIKQLGKAYQWPGKFPKYWWLLDSNTVKKGIPMAIGKFPKKPRSHSLLVSRQCLQNCLWWWGILPKLNTAILYSWQNWSFGAILVIVACLLLIFCVFLIRWYPIFILHFLQSLCYGWFATSETLIFVLCSSDVAVTEHIFSCFFNESFHYG